MSEESTTRSRPEPAGLRGFLILVAIGLVLAPVRHLAAVAQTFVPVFRGGAWTALTTPGSGAYHPLAGPLLIGEMLGNLAFIVAGVALLLFFFRRSRRFPKLYVVVAIANLLFALGDAWLGSLVLRDQPLFDPDTARELGRATIRVVAWVPYMLVSKRVKHTFVEGLS